MDWNEFYGTWQEEIDEADSRADKYWLLVLLLLIRHETALRGKLSRAALSLGVARGGFVDTTNAAAVRSFRVAAYASAAAFYRETARDLSGVTDMPKPGTLPASFVSKALAIGALMPALLAQESVSVRHAWAELSAVMAATAAAKGISVSAAWGAFSTDIEAAAASAEAVEDADLADALFDIIANINRNIRYESDRVIETAVRLSGPLGKRSAILDYIDGNGAGTEWHLNRNNMRLSTAEHLRALHRRRTISEGSARGVDNYRMDIPSASMANVSGGSAEGAHMWRVRSLPEWAAIVGGMNRGRVAGSSFDSFGLGFGDRSYLTPVPSSLLAEATEHGAAMRESHIARGAI